MTEIAQMERPFAGTLEAARPFGGQVVRAPQPSRSERMQEWLDLFIKTEHVAEVLARTSFVPAGMIGKPAEVAASMMKGFELGMDPLDALQNMFVVKGKVGFYAEFMRRRIIKAGHEFYVTEATDNRAVVKGRRRDGNFEGEWQQASFTAEQAKKAGIDLGGYPADKLVARATSRLCRRAFPDVLSGAEIVEDIEDGLVVVDSERLEAAPVQEPRALQRKRQPRKQTQRSAPPPVVEEQPSTIDETGIDEFPGAPEEAQADEPEEAELPSEDSEVRMVTDAQLKKLQILLRAEGFGDDKEGRQGRLDWCSTAINRPISSSKDLTLQEASALIDLLEQAQAQDQQKGK